MKSLKKTDKKVKRTKYRQNISDVLYMIFAFQIYELVESSVWWILKNAPIALIAPRCYKCFFKYMRGDNLITFDKNRQFNHYCNLITFAMTQGFKMLTTHKCRRYNPFKRC